MSEENDQLPDEAASEGEEAVKSAPAKVAQQDENPLLNIIINVILPVLALKHLSKEEGSFWHIGPVWALVVALALPLGYGVWHFAKTKQLNLFSGIGIFSVVLTGGLTIYLWNDDGTVKDNAAELFGIKEGMIPLVLGLCIFFSHWTKTPLLNAFLYSDSLFDVRRIEKRVKQRENQAPYRKLLFKCTVLFLVSFIISAVANYFLALHFFADVVDRETYNDAVGRMTWWGFVVIGGPFIFILAGMMFMLVKGLKALTGLETEQVMLGR